MSKEVSLWMKWEGIDEKSTSPKWEVKRKKMKKKVPQNCTLGILKIQIIFAVSFHRARHHVKHLITCSSQNIPIKHVIFHSL